MTLLFRFGVCHWRVGIMGREARTAWWNLAQRGSQQVSGKS